MTKKQTARKSGAQRKVSKSVATLSQLLALRLRALYDVETESLKAGNLLAKKTSVERLLSAMEKNATAQEGQIERLEDLIDTFEETAPKIRIEAIRGMAQDGKNIMTLVPTGPALDASIILELQYQIHYAKAGYEIAIAWAEQLDETEIAETLEDTLNEKEKADEDLSALLENEINPAVPADDE